MPSFFRASFLFLSVLLFGLVSASRLANRGRIPGLLQPLTGHAHTPRKISRRSCRPSLPAMTTSCFPAYGFQMPSEVPDTMDRWWCNPADEYAFLGFSYEITPCEFLTSRASRFMYLPLSRSEFIPATKGFCGHPKYLQRSLRSHLRGVRQSWFLVGPPSPACPTNMIDHRFCSNDIVTAAWDNTLGVHALVWVTNRSSFQTRVIAQNRLFCLLAVWL